MTDLAPGTDARPGDHRPVDARPGGARPGDARPVSPMERHFRELRRSGRKALVPYVMAGMCEDWPLVVQALVAAGADGVELGIPFSDPMIDGPVIQEAALRALEAGTTMTGVLVAAAGLDLPVPVVAMTYYNLILRAGHHRAARSMAEAGVSGAIIPDLSLEELGPWAVEADAAGVDTVLLVAPSTPADRVAALCARSRGFVYAVARMGVTGEQARLGQDAPDVVARINACSDAPAFVGIGISRPDQAVEACRGADGVVVGSALVRRLLDGGGPEAAGELVASFRGALDAAFG